MLQLASASSLPFSTEEKALVEDVVAQYSTGTGSGSDVADAAFEHVQARAAAAAAMESAPGPTATLSKTSAGDIQIHSGVLGGMKHACASALAGAGNGCARGILQVGMLLITAGERLATVCEQMGDEADE